LLLTGEHLRDARAEIQTLDQAIVRFTLDSEGARLFAQATQDNLHRQIAIVLDDTIVSAPTVNAVITGGEAYIDGMNAEQASNLALTLRSGALPVSFEILEKRTVGPTLGADSLERSLQAGIVGLIAILVFMLGYYRLPGLVANISLVLYTILVLGSMVLLGAVLTLPGIAGFVLSIGFALDANIIIYERIKEELRSGKSLRAAVDIGFKRATLTIIDANLTTLIVALVLMYFGTGPIKGFAVTLTLGIVLSFLTAMLFTRLLMYLFTRFITNPKLYNA
jgi:preprotein translocase subunit SecD